MRHVEEAAWLLPIHEEDVCVDLLPELIQHVEQLHKARQKNTDHDV